MIKLMNIEFWKDISPIVQMLVTLVIGAGVFYVAWQQWRTAKRKLDLDLFERRLKVFVATRDFLDSIRSNQGTTLVALERFLHDTSSAYFLFRREMSELLVEIYQRSIDIGLPSIQREEATFTEDEKAAQWQKVHALSMDFDRYKLERKFATHMNLVDRG